MTKCEVNRIQHFEISVKIEQAIIPWYILSVVLKKKGVKSCNLSGTAAHTTYTLRLFQMISWEIESTMFIHVCSRRDGAWWKSPQNYTFQSNLIPGNTPTNSFTLNSNPTLQFNFNSHSFTSLGQWIYQWLVMEDRIWSQVCPRALQAARKASLTKLFSDWFVCFSLQIRADI